VVFNEYQYRVTRKVLKVAQPVDLRRIDRLICLIVSLTNPALVLCSCQSPVQMFRIDEPREKDSTVTRLINMLYQLQPLYIGPYFFEREGSKL